MIAPTTELAVAPPQEAVAVLVDQGWLGRRAWRCPGCGEDVVFDALIISCRCAESAPESPAIKLSRAA